MKWNSYALTIWILTISSIARLIYDDKYQESLSTSPDLDDTARNALQSSAPKPKLIIFIMGDDIGPGDLGFEIAVSNKKRYKIATPYIDYIRTQSALYPNVIGATVCGPSRASFLTGIPQTYSPWRSNFASTQNNSAKYTLPLALQKLGWVPIISGKFGFGTCNDSSSVKKFGFERSFYYATHIDAHYPFPAKLYNNCSIVKYSNNDDTSRSKCLGNKCISANDQFLSYTISQIVDCAKAKIRCAIFHMPTYTHAGKYSNIQKLSYPVDGYEGYPQSWGQDLRGYAAMLTKFDKHIGAIFKSVKAVGLQNETLTLIFSDNGAECIYIKGIKKCTFDIFASTGGRRDRKRSMYRGGLDTPVMAHWPSVILPKYSSDYPWALHDFPLTILDILQAPYSITRLFAPPMGISQGTPISVSSILLGRDSVIPQRNYLFAENCENGDESCTYAVYNTSDWRNSLPKVVCNTPGCIVQYYDIKSDPAEKNNLAKNFQNQVKDMLEIRSTNRLAVSPRP